METFIGRKRELVELQRVFEGRIASLVVVKGRRRIGKSRLIAEFAKQYTFYPFMGLAPRKGMAAQNQRNEFSRQLGSYFGFSALGYEEDWGNLFSFLAKQTQAGKIVILLDEISWMANGDPDFLGKLKIIWDLEFSKNNQLMLILCGSISSWIEENILGSTGYLGRPSLHMTLNELPLSDCNQFWGDNKNISAFEKLKMLSLTGGVPRYLELMDPKLTAEENIRLLCFNKNGPLYDEFKYIFSDIYGKRGVIYQKIVEFLSQGSASRESISKNTNLHQSGDLTTYLTELEQGGFIVREHTWSIKTGKESKLSHYRLSDNYTRFYLKYIYPNKTLIEKDRFEDTSIHSLPAWYSILALQFENLVLNNHKIITRLLGIRAEDILMENPYFQRKTQRHAGCQIDYMIQTKYDTVYLCEIKFSRHETGNEIIKEVSEKMDKLKLPKHISRRPVLIHVNGVKDEVLDELFFHKIIDFTDVLERR